MTMKLSLFRVEEYLTRLLGKDVQVLALESLTDCQGTTVLEDGTSRRALRQSSTPALKKYGYGQPVLVHYRVASDERRAVLRTMASTPFGFERRADRAASVMLSYDTFNDLPRHTRALDIGVLTPDLHLRSLSLGTGDEFFVLTDYVEGDAYVRDLQRLQDTGQLTDLDVRRAQRLAAYLAEIHAVKHDDPILYRRRLRDLVGSGEGILGITDNYPSDFPFVDAVWLERVDQACVSWRWRLKARTHRLCQVHGDFHPFNVLFAADVDLWLIDRSRGVWGEPGDDVSSMSINYLLFSLQRSGTMASPFDELWNAFWTTYMEITGDQEILAVVLPFFVWRALVVASPVWTNISDAVRKVLFRFIENVLHQEVFDPARMHDYLR
ncbi:hypothetical protein NKDENANG_01430 [Candidatus Entotheonellaceae bacterium PAL068K]